MSYPIPDPVKEAEEYAEYLEDYGEEIPETDHYKTLCECFEIMNEYNREMKKRGKDGVSFIESRRN